jgi:Protein of unknown function (DUF1573)
MKKYILSTAVVILASFSLTAQQIKFDYETPKIKFEPIEEGSKGIFLVGFTNIGDAPLIITRARTSSGGSMATYPREPILPQQKSYIQIKYDTQRVGRFVRTLVVESNSLQDATLRFYLEGEVVPKKLPNTENK